MQQKRSIEKILGIMNVSANIKVGVFYESKHITILERESIFKFLTLGYSLEEIAIQLDRNRSTIGREIDQRNA